MMKQLSVLVCAIAMAACSTVNNYEKQKASATYIRRNAHSTEARADLEAMARGLAAMKKLPCTDPRSWYYQGGMHHIPDTINGPNQLCPEYQNKSQLMTGWSTCPHMLPELQQFHFLTWHRLYIYYYEKLVRKMSGKSDFALPYWDYNQATERTMPEQFIQPASYDSNALFEQNRSRYLLEGNAIAANDSDVVVMNVQILGKDTIVPVAKAPMKIVLDSTYLWDAGDIHHFSYELEDGPHNTMHDYTGGAVDSLDVSAPIYNRIYQQNTLGLQGLMADVPSAGFDPIFFLHHANIDRLWMNWEISYPEKMLTWDDFQKAGSWTYIFFDENGKQVQYNSMQQVYDSIRAIDYTYDYLASKGRLMGAPEKRTFFANPQMVTSVQPSKKLGVPHDRFTVALSNPLSSVKNDELIYSLEVTFSFPKENDNRIAIIVDDGVLPKPGESYKDHIVGIADFFGAGHHAHGGHEGHQHGHGRISKTMVYDITDELTLQNINNLKDLHVHFHQLAPDPSIPFYVESIRVKKYTRNQK